MNNKIVCDRNHSGPLKDFFDDCDFYLADDEIFAFDTSEFKSFKRDVDLVDELGGRLMNYRNAVGETVVRYDGVKGIITQVDEGNVVHIQFDGERFAGGYLYDPFINEDVRFVNTEWQNPIDEIINELHEKALKTMKKYMVDSSKEETFRITKDNEDGSKEVVCRLRCTEEDAYRIFALFIKDQQKEYRKADGRIRWRVIRLFDSVNNQQIAQES